MNNEPNTEYMHTYIQMLTNVASLTKCDVKPLKLVIIIINAIRQKERQLLDRINST